MTHQPFCGCLSWAGSEGLAAASQAGSALTLLEDEDAVSRPIALPTPGCSCHKHQEGLATL